MLTKQEVEAIKARAEKAPPWPEPRNYEGYEGIVAASFACHAKADVAALCATVEELLDLCMSAYSSLMESSLVGAGAKVVMDRIEAAQK